MSARTGREGSWMPMLVSAAFVLSLLGLVVLANASNGSRPAPLPAPRPSTSGP